MVDGLRMMGEDKGQSIVMGPFFSLCEILTDLHKDGTDYLNLISTALQAAEHFAFIILIM